MTGFNTVSRANTGSAKWDALQEVFGTVDVLPMWVADMDFQVPEAVVQAVQERTMHGVFGYSIMTDSYKQAVVGWMSRKHNWEVQADSILFSPGVVPALSQIVQAFTEPGDQVIIQPPVYPPFYRVVTNQGRELALNPLREHIDGTYSIDFEHLESLMMNDKAKLLILCSPHNPVGRVWSRSELEQLDSLAEKYDVLVVSDEIHADLVFEPHQHIPYAALSEAAANRSIMCTAPSKTFNLASLHTSNLIVPNPKLRKQLEKTLRMNETPGIGALGLAAAEAAYQHGDQWLTEVLAYIKSNLEFVHNHLASYTKPDGSPLVRSVIPESTYLLWMDFRALGLTAKELKQFIIDEARLGLNDGADFGTQGEGFMRMNLACSRSTVEEAMNRLDQAIETYSKRTFR